MKKIIIALLVLIPTVSFASIDVNLKYGARGAEVIELQEFLIDKGFLAGTATGNFYTLTRRAVVNYQNSVKLPTSGFVGALTREKINAELATSDDTEAEMQETGTVSTPVTTENKPDNVRKQLDMLIQQLAELTKQKAQKPTAPTPTYFVPKPEPAPVPPVVITPVPPTEVFSTITTDNFDEYADRSIVGQGGWQSYTRGENFVALATSTALGSKTMYINAKGDSVVTKTGHLVLDGSMSIYVKTDNAGWSESTDGNAQVRVSKGSWASGAPNLPFATVSFKKNGNVAYFDADDTHQYRNFATYADGEWTHVEIQWQSSDKTARYRVNDGVWTAWHTFQNADNFAGFDNVGFDFVSSGTGGVYFDNLQ
jgi:peptidoglycan hydrolase-like protein with peptidoglycan-binding domain